MVSERLRALRERINRREQSTRADRRASSRRVERGEPETTGERVQVATRRTKEEAEMTAEEARELASDAKTLVATEMGVSRSESESVISQGAGLLEDAGDRINQLDIDGDGDTDVFTGLDPLGGEDRGGNGNNGGPESIEAVDDGDGMSFDGASAADPVFDPFEEGPQ